MRAVLPCLILMLALAGCGSEPGAQAPTSSPMSSSSSVAPATTVTTTSAAPTWPDTWTDEADANYLAELRQRGFNVTDEDDAVLAGSGFCFLITERGSLIDASAETMDNFDYTPDQIRAVTGAALAAYCPELG